MNLRLQLSPDAPLVEASVEAVAGWRLLVGERAVVLQPVAELLIEDMSIGPEMPPFEQMEIVPISTAPMTTYECTYLATLARHDEHYSEILDCIRFRAGIKAGATVRWFYLSDCHYAPLTTEEIARLSALRRDIERQAAMAAKLATERERLEPALAAAKTLVQEIDSGYARASEKLADLKKYYPAEPLAPQIRARILSKGVNESFLDWVTAERHKGSRMPSVAVALKHAQEKGWKGKRGGLSRPIVGRWLRTIGEVSRKLTEPTDRSGPSEDAMNHIAPNFDLSRL